MSANPAPARLDPISEISSGRFYMSRGSKVVAQTSGDVQNLRGQHGSQQDYCAANNCALGFDKKGNLCPPAQFSVRPLYQNSSRYGTLMSSLFDVVPVYGLPRHRRSLQIPFVFCVRSKPLDSRPLRRRRKTVLTSANRLRGTAALQVVIDRC